MTKRLIIRYFTFISQYSRVMVKTALDRYSKVVVDALNDCGAKLRTSFQIAFIRAMVLFMVIPNKINFTQMGALQRKLRTSFSHAFRQAVRLAVLQHVAHKRISKDTAQTVFMCINIQTIESAILKSNTANLLF